MAEKAEVFKLFKSLDEEQTQIVELKKIEAAHTANAWLNLLGQVASLDKAGDKYRAYPNITWQIIVCVIVILISIFLAIGTGNPYILILTAIAIGIIVKLSLDQSKINKLDLSNHLRKVIMPLISILKEDISRKSKIYLKASFEKHDTAEYKVNEIPAGKKYPKIVESHFKIPRIQLKTTLVDSTQIQLDYSDLVRKKDITKKNPRGKIKNKVKYKIKHLVLIKLYYSNGVYHKLENIDLPADVIYTSKEQSHCFKTKLSEVTTDKEHCLPTKKILAAIARIYKCVQPIGKTTAGME